MLCSILSSRSRATFTKLSSRSFHATPRKRDHTARAAVVEQFGLKCYAFHDVFQYVHDFTALPWLISIPLATFLLRALITPAKYYFTLCRRDQRLAEPKLNLAAKIVDRQSAMRLSARVDTAEGSDGWKRKEWKLWQDKIERDYPRAKINPLVSTKTNFDASNLSTMGMFLVNASTLLSLHAGNSSMFDFELTELQRAPLLVAFVAIAAFNLHYYHGDLSASLGTSSPPPKLGSILRMSDAEEKMFVCIIPPLLIGWHLADFPAVVILYGLSHTFYTSVEPHIVDMIVGLPARVDTRPRNAVQTTRRPK